MGTGPLTPATRAAADPEAVSPCTLTGTSPSRVPGTCMVETHRIRAAMALPARAFSTTMVGV